MDYNKGQDIGTEVNCNFFCWNFGFEENDIENYTYIKFKTSKFFIIWMITM
jgi:hypothetical protein